MKKTLLAVLALASAGSPAAGALAQGTGADYPLRPIRILVGFPPGGTTDILARILAAHLAPTWSQQVVIDNRSGASGIVATTIAAKATPDGYTLIMVPSGSFTINGSIYEKLPYDTVKDFAAISRLAWVTNVLLVSHGSPAQTLQDLIRMAKDKPGQYSYGSSGNGSLHHLAGEVFKNLTGTNTVHVPFKGGAPMLVALAASEVTFGFNSVPSAMPLILAKRIRPVVVTSQKRSVALPDVPTIAEAGVVLPAGLEMREWYGMVAPAGTPQVIVDKLNAEMVTIFRKPQVQTQLSELGAESAASTSRELAAQIALDVKTWAKVVKGAGVRAE